MIEVGLMTALGADEEIRARVSREGAGLRIYLGRVPQGMKIDGGTIVVSKIGADHDYGLVNEAPSVIRTLQVDCYDLKPQDADSLAELVTTRASGANAIGAKWGDHFVHSSTIESERTEYEKPQGGTDDWRPRDSRDYRVHHS
jgi:hypothetical protein